MLNWVPILTLGVFLISMFYVARQWWSARLLYGRLLGRAAWLMAVCWHLTRRRFVIFGAFFFLGGGVGPSIMGCALDATELLFGAFLASFAVAFASTNLLPPGVLFLATSGNVSDSARRMVQRIARRHRFRVVYLLRGQMSGMFQLPANLHPADYAFENDNLRTRNDELWKRVLHRLIALTPVIVLDSRVATDAIAHESRRIVGSSARYKTIFLTDRGVEHCEAGRLLMDLPADGSRVTVTRPIYDHLDLSITEHLRLQMQATSAEGQPRYCEPLGNEKPILARKTKLTLGFWVQASVALLAGLLAALILTITVVVNDSVTPMGSYHGKNVLELPPGGDARAVSAHLARCGGALAGASLAFALFSLASFKGYGTPLHSPNDLLAWLEKTAEESESWGK